MTQQIRRSGNTLSKCLLYGALAATLVLCWQMRPEQPGSEAPVSEPPVRDLSVSEPSVQAIDRAASTASIANLSPATHRPRASGFSANENVAADPEYSLVARLPVASQTELFRQPARPVRVAESAAKVAANAALPPLPFKYLGLWQQQDERKLLLESDGEVLTVSVGEKINALYQLQSIAKNAEVTQIKILYLPLHTIQLMTLANSGNGDYAQ